MTPHRAGLVTRFLAGCHAVYGDHPGDLSTWQVVHSYGDPVNQRKYVHMYFAKSVGCWRYLRETVAPFQDGVVVSIGAGPCHCLIGWFFDTAPNPQFRVAGADVMPWDEIRGDAAFAALIDDVLGPATTFNYHAGRFFPPTCVIQVDRSGGLTAEFTPPAVRSDAA